MNSRLLIVLIGLFLIATGAGAAEDLKPIGSTLLIDASKLKLASANALVFDAQTGQPIYSKDADAVTAIASVTKLMTAMVVLDAQAADGRGADDRHRRPRHAARPAARGCGWAAR